MATSAASTASTQSSLSATSSAGTVDNAMKPDPAKVKNAPARFRWTPELAHTLILVNWQHHRKKRLAPDGKRRYTNWRRVAEVFKDRTRLSLTPAQAQNKWKQMQNDFVDYGHLLAAGALDTNGVVDEEQWARATAGRPELEKWRLGRFPHYDVLQGYFAEMPSRGERIQAVAGGAGAKGGAKLVLFRDVWPGSDDSGGETSDEDEKTSMVVADGGDTMEEQGAVAPLEHARVAERPAVGSKRMRSENAPNGRGKRAKTSDEGAPVTTLPSPPAPASSSPARSRAREFVCSDGADVPRLLLANADAPVRFVACKFVHAHIVVPPRTSDSQVTFDGCQFLETTITVPEHESEESTASEVERAHSDAKSTYKRAMEIVERCWSDQRLLHVVMRTFREDEKVAAEFVALPRSAREAFLQQMLKEHSE